MKFLCGSVIAGKVQLSIRTCKNVSTLIQELSSEFVSDEQYFRVQEISPNVTDTKMTNDMNYNNSNYKQHLIMRDSKFKSESSIYTNYIV